MLVNDVTNKEELSTLVISELKALGIKYRKEKKQKLIQDKCMRKRIFRTHLHLLDLTDVVLANGGIVQIPQFVADACQRILENVQTEGLFRKAGSSLRQKEIRITLEAGLPLGKTHHVIDVANVLKSFFRELPEPILPPNMHEAFIRGLLIGDERVKAILMACLLLPSLTVNTLAFFMQFLNTVSLSAHENKMSIENLAIIFTPGLMPVNDITGIRFNNHVKVIQVLIQNAEMIGVLPSKIVQMLQQRFVTPLKSIDQEKKKKKRRSGSLTRMFNGLKKIVGAIGSAENLENTPNHSHTPCITKSTKKRKINEISSAFSTKKKRDILGLLPETGNLLANTPLCPKQNKKTRLSLGGRRNTKQIETITNVPSQQVERRWSVVGSGWTRKRHISDASKKDDKKKFSPVASLPCITDMELSNNHIFEKVINEENPIFQDYDENYKTSDSEFVRIPKSEYEAIKERVSAIESRISQEFINVRNSLLESSMQDLQTENNLNGPESVLSKFEKTIEETENIISPSTEQLAKRLSRELKIRRSAENRILRSPSARKIGTIRRRSKEKIRLSRNKTWHITTSHCEGNDKQYMSTVNFYPKSNLKRGRPNTLQTGLPHPNATNDDESIEQEANNKNGFHIEDKWMSGELFFKDTIPTDNKIKVQSDILYESDGDSSMNSSFSNMPGTSLEIKHATPKFITSITINEAQTPMLPPSAIPKKTTSVKALKSISTKPNITSRTLFTPTDDTQNGRASIVRLRAQNAGMVLAKAKLFDGLGSESDSSRNNSIENKSKKPHFVSGREQSGPKNGVDLTSSSPCGKNFKSKSNEVNVKTPKRQNLKSPGFVQKRNKKVMGRCHDKILIETLINEEDYTKSGKFKSSLRNRNYESSPAYSPKVRKATLKVSSPRRGRPTNRNGGHSSTTNLLKSTQLTLMNSPKSRFYQRNKNF